jgi:hypothetical protein
MPVYSDEATTICRSALEVVCDLLSSHGVSYCVIGGSAVLAILDARGERGSEVGYVGTLDVDIAAANRDERAKIERVLIEAGGRPAPDDPNRLLLPIEVDGETVDAPIDLPSSTLVGLGAVPTRIPTLTVPLLLLSKLRPYENKGAKDKDGYDAYVLLAHAVDTPEELAMETAETLPRDLAEELLKLIEVFFMKKRRAARDAANLLAQYRGADRSEIIPDAMNLATRFARRLRRLLEE